jgi:hypothetical protein
MQFTSSAEPGLQRAAPPREFDLLMLAAMACVPAEVVGFCVARWSQSVCAVVFAGGIGIHWFLRYRAGRSFSAAGWTGAWLLPLLTLLFVASDTAFTFWSAGLLIIVPVTSLLGLLVGVIVAAQFEAVLVLGSLAARRMSGGSPRRARSQLIQERIDEESTPLEAPPEHGIPRRFGIRGLLIVTTWAAVIMGILRACRAEPWVYFMVITFAAGTLAAQVLLFRGRNPSKASMWAGAFLLPAEVLVVNLWLRSYAGPAQFENFIYGSVAGCACLVPGGILLGAAAGAIGGGLYYFSENFFLWLTRGLPKIALEPVTEADADVLLRWIGGPNFCQRWAGDRFNWPLDGPQLLERFAVARDRTFRKVYKAVDLRSGNMVGYVELGRIDYTLRRAWVELPLVDPDASERGRIGVRMLQSLADYAFGTLGLFSIIIVADSDQSELALCCQKACQASFEHYSRANKQGESWIATVRRFTPLA